MPKVQKLNLGFNSNEWRSHTFETVCFSHLAALTDVSVKFGARGAEEFNIKAAQYALEAVVTNHPNCVIVRVQFVEVIFYVEEDVIIFSRLEEDHTESNPAEEEEGERHEIQEGTDEALVESLETRSPRAPYLQPARKVGIAGFFKHLYADIMRPIKTNPAPAGTGRRGGNGATSLSSTPYAVATQRTGRHCWIFAHRIDHIKTRRTRTHKKL